ncbi:MAG: HEAT repeat domain-containing protein [Deferrisomatales bacterium]
MERAAGSNDPAPDCAETVEAFARDLLALVRAVKVYPSSHPFLSEAAHRLMERVRAEMPAPLELGVMGDELTLGKVSVGGKHSRAAYLAAHLHLRRVLRLVWTREATVADAVGFAEVLADLSRSGEELLQALRERAVCAIAVEPLDLERLHESFEEGALLGPEAAARDARDLWEWLLNQNTTALEVAEALATGEPWDAEAPEVARWLLSLGRKLQEALALMSGEGRKAVAGRLTELGDSLGSREMGELLLAADAREGLHGPLVSGVSQGVKGERLVDVLAAMISLEGRDTRRIADVFRRFAPEGGEDLLPLVRARLSEGPSTGFALDVWKAVESFLLELDEDPFMGEDYASSLEGLSGDGASPVGETPAGELLEDVTDQLDGVYLLLASTDPLAWGGALLDRLESRVFGERPETLARFLNLVERSLPGLVGKRPRLVHAVFDGACRNLRGTDAEGREALFAFVRRHEGLLLDAVLRALGQEERLAVRRFLVEALCAFSPAATPALVLRLRSGPWFVTRNLATVLGRRGDPRTIPALRSLLSHENTHVRHEAVQALARIPVPAARSALAEFLQRAPYGGEERGLVERALVEARAERG